MPKKNEKPKGNEKTVRMVYLGKRYWKDSGIMHVYAPIESLPDRKEEVFFGQPLGASKRSADLTLGIYEGIVVIQEDGTRTALGVGSWRYVEFLQGHDDLRTEMVALSEAAEGELKTAKEKKKRKSEDPIYEALAPIRKAMRKTNAAGRRAIMAKVIECLNK